MKKLLFKWDNLKATFWFVPVIIILFSIFLSIAMVYLDGFITLPQNGLSRFFFVSSSDSARSILSTISGAMMGVAGTVFSITLVALTLASSQFGPRLIKNFMYVRLNQIVLGSYISTYLYCLLVLNAIKDDGQFTFIPSLSIIIAILAAICNIILLIIFIHRIAVSIQADKVISDISDFISKQVESLFPKELDEVKENNQEPDVKKLLSGYKHSISLKAPNSGYLQYVDLDSILEYMTKTDSLIELGHRAGSHLVKDLELALLYTNDEELRDEGEKIFKHFVIGKTKTSQQDLEFSIHQMVEIASRALSPGVNDPYTAITCIDNLTTTMSYLAKAKFPSKYQFDDDKQLRVIADVIDFEGVLDAAFNQIRQFSVASTAVIIRLMEALTIIYHFTSNETQQKAVIKHANMVLTVGKETIKEKNDIEDLEKRAERILKN